jgi:predicted transcriptional regulator
MATSIKLDPIEQERLRALAGARDRTPHYLMREAIRQYLEREEARESFKAEALASWAEYRQTGLHLTGVETDEWLDSWGSERTEKAPICHE